MTEEKLCGGKTFKEVMEEVDFHISDKQRIAELEKENAELRERITDLNKPPLCDGYSLHKENEELKEQIEKMKCCGNCYHRFESNSFHCGDCKRFVGGINTEDKWELAE